MVVGGADGRQSPAIGPGHRCPVVPGGEVPYGVVDDGMVVVGCQQVLPVAVAVGVGDSICPVADRPEVAEGVIGIGDRRAAPGFGQELALGVIGVGRAVAARDA